MCTQTHKYQQKQAWAKAMYENAHVQTVAADFSRRREQEPSFKERLLV